MEKIKLEATYGYLQKTSWSLENLWAMTEALERRRCTYLEQIMSEEIESRKIVNRVIESSFDI